MRRTYADGDITTPKNHEKREVYITPDVVDLLGAWWGECGRPDDATLVADDPSSGYLYDQTILRRELYPATERAGIPRVGNFTGGRLRSERSTASGTPSPRLRSRTARS